MKEMKWYVLITDVTRLQLMLIILMSMIALIGCSGQEKGNTAFKKEEHQVVQ